MSEYVFKCIECECIMMSHLLHENDEENKLFKNNRYYSCPKCGETIFYIKNKGYQLE